MEETYWIPLSRSVQGKLLNERGMKIYMMDRVEYWQNYLEIIARVFGLIAGAWALPLGMDSLAAGISYGSTAGFLASALAFGSGYVLIRSGMEERIDRRFVIALGVLIAVSIFVIAILKTPLNVFQQIGRW